MDEFGRMGIMPRTKATKAVMDVVQGEESNYRPRLRKLKIKNLKCIGSTPVEIELDDIVVLVGPNNAGKSTILKAYALAMSDGSSDCKLTLDDFPNGVVDPQNLPEIELETIVYDQAPGQVWIANDPHSGEMVVREKWVWSDVDKQPKRTGWLPNEEKWAEEGMPWGAANVANTRRPQPHRIDAFDSPEHQASEIIKLLKKILDDSIKILRESEDDTEKTSYTALLTQIGSLQRTIVDKAQEQISTVEQKLSNTIKDVFPGYKVTFNPRAEEKLEDCIKWFSASPTLLMGPSDGHLSKVEHQGSGARRTLLWAALRILKEQTQNKKTSTERPHLLLLDEPELCLHPDAIREACKVLYELPSTNNWQVMITTHSPIFIDFSRDNTTIIRVERDEKGNVSSTTLFRPSRSKLDEDDRKHLKMLNLCDPYVAEFLFGGRAVIVEGDTEYTAFKQVMASDPARYNNIHVIRARGKATIISLCKILNQFGARYSILHDSDMPETIIKKGKRKGETMANPAWAHNENILNTVLDAPAPERIRLVASIPNVEAAYFGDLLDEEKPYNALLQMKNSDFAFLNTEKLLQGLIDFNQPLPSGACEWNNIEILKDRVAQSRHIQN